MAVATYYVEVADFGHDKKAAVKAAKLLKDKLNISGRCSYLSEEFTRDMEPTVIRVEVNEYQHSCIYEGRKGYMDLIRNSKRIYRNEDSIVVGEL